MPATLEYEEILWQNGYNYLAGVDEVGRGCLAGPVVAAAVIFPSRVVLNGIDDSKKLSPQARERCLAKIQQKAVAISIGICMPEEIDSLNILQASLEAMRRAILSLKTRPDYSLIDGLYKVNLSLPQRCLKHGDGQSISIAAASIVAKVYRDQVMTTYHNLFPQYNLKQNKGYPTAEHKQAIKNYGISYLHRRSFRPCHD
jgi:ribonuclease HII